MLVVEANDVFFAALNLYLLDYFLVDLFGIAVDLTVLQNDFVELEMHPCYLGERVCRTENELIQMMLQEELRVVAEDVLYCREQGI